MKDGIVNACGPKGAEGMILQALNEHYQRLLDYIVPDFVHVLYNGKIVMSGNKELALELKRRVMIG